jgi:putative protease
VELICPAGGLPALKAAVDHGADAAYIGFRDGTNARNFPGLNFSEVEARQGRDYAHAAGARMFVALNINPSPAQWAGACRAADAAVALGADALIVADLGLLRYVSRRYPEQRLHLSVQGSATNYEAIGFYAREFGVSRVVLPRVLSLAQVRSICKRVNVEIEVFGFGSLCIMVEGRCQLSSYVTGDSPNLSGVCSPARAVRWEEDAQGRDAGLGAASAQPKTGPERRSRLNGVLIDVYRPGEPAGYPTLCKGRFDVAGRTYYALEEPTGLNVLGILPELYRAGVAAIKVEGRQRSPAYVAEVTRVLRAALDECLRDPDGFAPRAEWMAALDRLAEGSCHTLGAYDRPWQ